MILMNNFKEGDYVRFDATKVYRVCYVGDTFIDVAPADDPNTKSIEFIPFDAVRIVPKAVLFGDKYRVRTSGNILLVLHVTEVYVGYWNSATRKIESIGVEELTNSDYYEYLEN